MRNMSFFHTQQQIRDRSKTVTRRMGWRFLKPGDLVRAVVKGQGLRKGENVEPLAVLRIVSVSRERLSEIGQADVDREGFPEMGKWGFIEMFCEMNNCEPRTEITRIEFEYVEEEA